MAHADLSPQQVKVMQYIADGETIKNIKLLMGITSASVRKHITKARSKVGARSLYQCIAILTAEGVIIVNLETCRENPEEK